MAARGFRADLLPEPDSHLTYRISYLPYMCGRYLRRSDLQRIATYFQLHGLPPFPLADDFNVAPSSFQPVVRLNRDTLQRELVLMRWGLVPFHATSLAEYRGISTINARAENVNQGMWKRIFARQRCLIPVDGYYEWKQEPGVKGKTKKRPIAFMMKNELPFALAGMWDAWRDPETDEWLQSFVIITTVANELMEGVHDRMPVILEQKDFARWLDRSPDQQLPLDLLQSYDATMMKAMEANPAVGNVRNNGPEMLDAPPDEPDELEGGLPF